MRRCAFLLAAILFFPSPAQAAGSIATVYVTTKEPVAGKPITLEIGITTSDPQGWKPSDYAFVVALRANDGTLIAQSRSIAGTQAVSSGQVTVEFVQWALPQGISGFYQIDVTLQHGGTNADTSPRLSISLGPQNASTQVITRPSASPPPACVHGSTQSTENFGVPSETTVVSLHGCAGEGGSYKISGGFSSAPGSVRPEAELVLAQTQLQAGAISPQFNPLSIDGLSGDGGFFQQAWGPQQSFSATWLRQQGNPLGPSFAAINYSIRSPSVTTEFSFGRTRSPGDPDPAALSTWGDGDFETLALTWQPPPMRDSFGVRLGLVNYLDADGQTRHSDRALEAFATVSIGATVWNLDELRTGPFYLAPGAPAIIADRDAQTISATFPIGRAAATLSATGYQDDLPGANLSLKTNNWSENATFSIPVHDDLATLTFTGGSQQQDGDFPSNFATNGFLAVYVLKRGDQAVQFTYGVTGIRNDPDQSQAQTQYGLQFSRTVARGLSLTFGTNLAGVRASAPDGASFTHTSFLTVAYACDPWSISGSAAQTIAQPGAGVAPLPTLALNAGLSYNLAEHLSLKLSLTRMNGAAPATIGNLALGTQF